jgi:hypothetical protein
MRDTGASGRTTSSGRVQPLDLSGFTLSAASSRSGTSAAPLLGHNGGLPCSRRGSRLVCSCHLHRSQRPLGVSFARRGVVLGCHSRAGACLSSSNARSSASVYRRIPLLSRIRRREGESDLSTHRPRRPAARVRQYARPRDVTAKAVAPAGSRRGVHHGCVLYSGTRLARERLASMFDYPVQLEQRRQPSPGAELPRIGAVRAGVEAVGPERGSPADNRPSASSVSS